MPFINGKYIPRHPADPKEAPLKDTLSEYRDNGENRAEEKGKEKQASRAIEQEEEPANEEELIRENIELLVANERKKNSPLRNALRLKSKTLLTVFLVTCIVIMLFGGAASNAATVVICLALMFIGCIAYYLVL